MSTNTLESESIVEEIKQEQPEENLKEEENAKIDSIEPEKLTKMEDAKFEFERLPLTMISGFLGAGKTTLLQHILTNKSNLKCAVIVNDVAALNIDSALVSNGDFLTGDEKLVSLENGCICCSLRPELVHEIAQLAKAGAYDYLVIEPTGVSEPHKVAEGFDEFVGQYVDRSEEEVKLQEMIRLDCCVTVVDCSSFMDYFETTDLASERFEETEEDDDRLIIQLLVDQVEFANVILLNKTDLCTKEQVAKIKEAILKLNSKAKLIETTQSVVDLKEVINTNAFDYETMEMEHKGFKKEEEKKEEEERGPEDVITNFVYQRPRPFNTQRIHALLESAFLMDISLPDEHDHDHDEEEEEEGSQEEEEDEEEEEEDPEYQAKLEEAKVVYKNDRAATVLKKKTTVFKDVVRSKGFLWLSNKPEYFFEWSQAAISGNFSIGGPWVITAKGQKSLDEQAAENDIGDRSQNLVWIGKNMDTMRPQIEAALDECLVTEEEWQGMLQNRLTQEFCSDPFERCMHGEGECALPH